MYNCHLKIVEDSNTITAAAQFLLMTKKNKCLPTITANTAFEPIIKQRQQKSEQNQRNYI